MTVEIDYNNANLFIKRGDEIVHTFEFKDFVPAIEVKEINTLKNKIFQVYKKEASDEVQKELEDLEEKYFNTLLSTAIVNPMKHSEALAKFSIPEINEISENVFVFLATWSSKAGVKQYGQLLAKQQTEKKEQSG